MLCCAVLCCAPISVVLPSPHWPSHDLWQEDSCMWCKFYGGWTQRDRQVQGQRYQSEQGRRCPRPARTGSSSYYYILEPRFTQHLPEKAGTPITDAVPHPSFTPPVYVSQVHSWQKKISLYPSKTNNAMLGAKKRISILRPNTRIEESFLGNIAERCERPLILVSVGEWAIFQKLRRHFTKNSLQSSGRRDITNGTWGRKEVGESPSSNTWTSSNIHLKQVTSQLLVNLGKYA